MLSAANILVVISKAYSTPSDPLRRNSKCFDARRRRQAALASRSEGVTRAAGNMPSPMTKACAPETMIRSSSQRLRSLDAQGRRPPWRAAMAQKGTRTNYSAHHLDVSSGGISEIGVCFKMSAPSPQKTTSSDRALALQILEKFTSTRVSVRRR